MSKVINIEFDDWQRVFFTDGLAIWPGLVKHTSVDAMADPVYISYTLSSCCPTYARDCFNGDSDNIFGTFEQARNSLLEKLKSEYEENVNIVNEQEELE